MKRNKKKNHSPKKKMDFSEFIDKLIKKYNGKENSIIHINSLSLENTIEKRRLYDLLNVMVALGICVKSGSHNYIWKSMDNIKDAFSTISYDIESRSIYESANEIFALPDSPSIGLITTKFLGIFLYLNIKTLNIRDAALFLASDNDHFKPVLRRLYLVAYLLERVRVFKRSSKIGEYQLDIDVDSICIKTLEKLARAEEFPPDSIEYQLNRFDANYLNMIHAARRFSMIEYENNIDSTGTSKIPMAYCRGIDI